MPEARAVRPVAAPEERWSSALPVRRTTSTRRSQGVLLPTAYYTGETFRPARQMYDTLITYKLGTSELQPALATEWTPSADFTQWTFKLREGVTFHDGTPFNAEAVCFNFDRWYNLKGAAAQTQAYYYGAVFEGFAQNETEAGLPPVYKSCAAPDPG